jgi:hypothetical protein
VDLKESKAQWGLKAIRGRLDLKDLLDSREFKALWEQWALPVHRDHKDLQVQP